MVRSKSSPLKNSQDDTEGRKKKYRSKNVRIMDGRLVRMRETLYREMRLLQTKTNLLIPKLAFSRVVREIMMDFEHTHLRIQVDALRALHEACEMYMVQFFEDSYYCTLHAKRKTLMVSDLQLCRRLRGRQDIINH